MSPPRVPSLPRVTSPQVYGGGICSNGGFLVPKGRLVYLVSLLLCLSNAPPAPLERRSRASRMPLLCLSNYPLLKSKSTRCSSYRLLATLPPSSPPPSTTSHARLPARTYVHGTTSTHNFSSIRLAHLQGCVAVWPSVHCPSVHTSKSSCPRRRLATNRQST